VKVPALLAVAFIGWEWMGPLARPRERVRPMLTAALVAAVVLELAARVTGLGWGWVPALSGPEKVSSAFTPTQLLAGALAVFHQLAGVGPGQAELLDLSRALGLVAAAIICAWLCWRSSRSGMVRALGLAFLVFVALGPVIEPWYLTWGLCVLAAVASGPTRRLMVVVGVAGTFLWLPDSWWVLSGAGQAGLLLVICAGGALALFGAGGLARLARVLVRAPAASAE
ncbi:MAG: polyprenol phosphomannose-dependent alpha 1,6 mannosyltransferase MptB, partial [Acidimicrobiales bacterium]